MFFSESTFRSGVETVTDNTATHNKFQIISRIIHTLNDLLTRDERTRKLFENMIMNKDKNENQKKNKRNHAAFDPIRPKGSDFQDRPKRLLSDFFLQNVTFGQFSSNTFSYQEPFSKNIIEASI